MSEEKDWALDFVDKNGNALIEKTGSLGERITESLGNVGSSTISSLGNVASAATQSVGTMGSATITSVGNLGVSMFDFAKKGIQTIGEFGTSICNSISSNINTSIISRHNEKLAKIKIEADKVAFKYQKQMQKEQNRHEEYIITEQRKVIEKMIDAATAAYDKKIDFIQAQLTSLEQTYSKERDLLSEHIMFLENERRESSDDIKKYMALSSDINKVEDKKSELYSNYLTAQGQLNDAVKYLEIDNTFKNAIGTTQTKFLERK